MELYQGNLVVRYLYMSIRLTELVLQNPDHSITMVLVLYSSMQSQNLHSDHIIMVLVLLLHLEPTGSVRLHKVPSSDLKVRQKSVDLLMSHSFLQLQHALYYSILVVQVQNLLLLKHQIGKLQSDLLDLYLLLLLLRVVVISPVQYSSMLVAGQPRLLLRRQTAI